MKKMFTARFFFMHIFVLFYYFKYLATNETSSVIIFAAYVKKKYSDMTWHIMIYFVWHFHFTNFYSENLLIVHNKVNEEMLKTHQAIYRKVTNEQNIDIIFTISALVTNSCHI